MQKPDKYVAGSDSRDQPELYALKSTAAEHDLPNVTFSPRYSNKLKWISIILSLFLIIILIVLVALVFGGSPTQEQASVCTSKECLQTAASLKSSIDEDIDPCTDFYGYVCGKWDEYNIGHSGEELTNFVKIADKVEHIIDKFMKQPSGESDPLPVKMVRNFYEACADTEKRNELGLEVMFKYLNQAGLPKVPSIFKLPPSQWKNYQFDWVKTSVLVKKIFGLDLFVQFNIEENLLDQSKYAMYILTKTGPPFLPQILDEEKIEKHDDYTILDELKTEFRPVVKHIISEVLINETINHKVLRRASDLIWNMTFQIPTAAKIVGGGKEYDNRVHELRKMTYADLQNLTDTLLAENGLRPLTDMESWRRYVELLYSEIGNTTLEDDEFYYFESELPYIVATPQYILKISGVMMELYAWWRAVFLMIGSTTDEIATTISDAVSVSWEDADCVTMTVHYLNSAVGFGIITDTFVTETKPEVTEFSESLREAFADRISELDWIDEETKEEALDKIYALGFVIGAPDWIRNETLVLRSYQDISIRNDTHLDNLLQLAQISTREVYKILKNDSNSVGGEITSITDANAYYKPLRNVMIIPWAILNSPVYHLGLRSLNYGALGTIIGHELTHGFDGIGRQYDYLSNFRMWWSEESLKKFNKKSTCFVKQYKKYTINIQNTKIPINATNTLNENIADNGGTKIAYRAFQNFLEKHGPDQSLPGFEKFTSEQMFFLAHAHLWCNREGSITDQFETHMDEHSPHDVRVKGILQNMKEFADTFHCPVGSGMNPNRPKCTMW